ncbi:MAG: hypothetical protein IKY64_01395 [Bacteroidaceae bacterium]|nr:hypothetical protein [Bacteroidaceae bacterium]
MGVLERNGEMEEKKRGNGEKSEKLPQKIEKYRKRKPLSPLLYIIYRKKTAI